MMKYATVVMHAACVRTMYLWKFGQRAGSNTYRARSDRLFDNKMVRLASKRLNVVALTG